MFTPEQITLFHAADTLRESIKTFHCSHYTSLLGINNIYFLTLYKHVEQVSFASLDKNENNHSLKQTLFNTCAEFCTNERKSAPLTYETKNAAFLNNLCQMLNVPFFKNEMQKKQKEPAMLFTQVLWNNYTRNWQKFITQQP